MLSVVFLSACSESGVSVGEDLRALSQVPTETPEVTNTPVTNTPVTNTPVADRFGAYIGDFGSGQGVYVLSPENQLSGLALAPNGTAASLFGNLGDGDSFNGALRSYFHTASTPANAGIFSSGELGANAPNPVPTQYDLNIIEGQTIESLSGASVNLAAAGAGEIAPSTPATVAGNWTGSHQFCGADLNNCSNLVTEITFSGTSVNGRTVIISPDGAEQFPNAIAGSIEQSGDVSTLTYTWAGNTYVGSIFFLPGSSTQLVFLGETAAEDAGNRTIASLLTR